MRWVRQFDKDVMAAPMTWGYAKGEWKELRDELKARNWKGGRILGSIKLDGKDLAEQLVQAGLARPYAGDKKKSWCE